MLGTNKLDLSRFNVWPAEGLLAYERLDEIRVLELLGNIQSTGTLINPIIWDENLKILIDGHHRVEALKILGANYIPVYHTNYMGSEVNVRNWFRHIFISAPEKLIKIIGSLNYSSESNSKNLHWNVIIEYDNDIIIEREFSNPTDAAETLHWACVLLMHDGYRVDIAPTNKVNKIDSKDVCVMYLDPILGKPQIIGAISSKFKLPHQVNRHLIDCRPVGINLPIDILKMPFNVGKEQMVNHLKKLDFKLTGPGRWYEGRFYEERLIECF